MGSVSGPSTTVIGVTEETQPELGQVDSAAPSAVPKLSLLHTVRTHLWEQVRADSHTPVDDKSTDRTAASSRTCPSRTEFHHGDQISAATLRSRQSTRIQALYVEVLHTNEYQPEGPEATVDQILAVTAMLKTEQCSITCER